MLYWVDPGLVRAVKKQTGPVAAEERGALLEGWILTLLRAYAQERGIYDDIHFWAPTQARQVEVDFLLERGRELLAIEVKSQRKVGPPLFAGLRAIAELPRVTRPVLVHLGERPMRTPDGIEVWPGASLLEALASNSLWP